MHWIISNKSKSNQIVIYPHLLVFSSGSMHLLVRSNVSTHISGIVSYKSYMIRSWAAGSKGVITLVPLVPWKILGLCCRMFSWLLTEGDGDRTYPWLPGLPGCSAPAEQRAEGNKQYTLITIITMQYYVSVLSPPHPFPAVSTPLAVTVCIKGLNGSSMFTMVWMTWSCASGNWDSHHFPGATLLRQKDQKQLQSTRQLI